MNRIWSPSGSITSAESSATNEPPGGAGGGTISGLLPLAPLAFHILLELAQGERHGYALKRAIAQRTDGAINPGPGVLYTTIAKMVDAGLIEESDERPDPHLDDERRRYYRITTLGRRVARAEAVRMRDLVEAADRRFGLPEPA